MACSMDDLEQSVVTKYTGSVVLVKMNPKNADKVCEYWDGVYEPQKRTAAYRERKELSGCPLYSTGFFMSEDENSFHVLTSAHMFSNLFSAAHPISAATIERLYNALIKCDHGTGYTPAIVKQVCCATDLFVLKIRKEELSKMCSTSQHHVVPLPFSFLSPLDRVVMISWPPELERTIVSGRVSNTSRDYSSLSDDNIHGYAMRLTEVDITSDFGSSGAPLFNSSGHCVGILQSGNKVFSYFISLDDIRKKLSEWGFLSTSSNS